MIPELSATYGLTPSEVWDLTQRQYERYIEHHEQLVREASRG